MGKKSLVRVPGTSKYFSQDKHIIFSSNVQWASKKFNNGEKIKTNNYFLVLSYEIANFYALLDAIHFLPGQFLTHQIIRCQTSFFGNRTCKYLK